MEPVILASASPRRQEILKRLGIPFITKPANIDETIPPGIKIEDAPEYLASRKVNAILRSFPKEQEVRWILGADTIVVLRNKIFGKPKSQDEAKNILLALRGNTHKVITGVALYNGEIHFMSTRTSVNKVTFSDMTDKDIDLYLSTSEWYGAAGAYRIQGLASCFITKIEGTESSVMGLPMFELYDMLREQNYGFTV